VDVGCQQFPEQRSRPAVSRNEGVRSQMRRSRIWHLERPEARHSPCLSEQHQSSRVAMGGDDVIRGAPDHLRHVIELAAEAAGAGGRGA